VKLDDRDERPGSKFYDWEIKGVPLRLEIGGKDIANKVMTFVRRDSGAKGTVSLDCLADGVQLILDTIVSDMYRKAWDGQTGAVLDITSLENIPDRILRFGWCGSEECGHTLEDKFELKILGTPYTDEKFKGKCIVCGKKTERPAYAARSM
jgi:prolyl-tRNA synthetase